MVGSTKDPAHPKEVASSIFAAVIVYAVGSLICILFPPLFAIGRVVME